MRKLVALVSVLFLSSGVLASDLTPEQIGHLTPKSMTVKEITVDSDSLLLEKQILADPPSGFPPLDEADLILDKIINMGKKVWAIIEAGKPVVNIKVDTASALPSGVTTWMQLEGWQTPAVRHYQVGFKNLYGAEVTRFDFRLLFTYGGSVRGQGRYLTSIKVIPSNVSVVWGYDLDALTEVPSVVNVGSGASPMAGAEIQVRWRVKTVLKHVEQTMTFFVKGDGSFEDLSVGPAVVQSL